MTSIYQIYPVWETGIVYGLGQNVEGSNGQIYRALSQHRSAAASEPVSGVSKATYWGNAPYQGATWTNNVRYAVGMNVTGTDNQIYTCKLRHLSAAGNKPITGGQTATYWAVAKPSVPRTRKQNGTIGMQDMVSDSGTRSAAPSYEAVMRKNRYEL